MTPTSSRASTYTLLTAVLAVVVVACLVLLVVKYAQDTDEEASFGDRVQQVFVGAEDDADDAATREQVLERATEFVERVNTYGPDDLDEDQKLSAYAEGVREVISAKFRVSFDENLTLAEQTVTGPGYARSVEVLSSGVESLDDDSASVLVAGTISGSYPDPEKQGGRISFEPEPFRFQVKLVRTEGEWLVDDFSPITGEEPGAAVPTPAPTQTPTQTPTQRPTQAPTQRPSQTPGGQSGQQGSGR